MSALMAVHARVKGRVQGVFFRAFALRQAKELALTGYTRNLPDGTVEVVAEGDKERLQKLIGALRVGPSGATVENVETTWTDYTGDFTSFVIKQ